MPSRHWRSAQSWQVLGAIHWALLLGAHVLADSGDGETPVVPDEIMHLSRESARGHPDPVVAFFDAVLRWAVLPPLLSLFFPCSLLSPMRYGCRKTHFAHIP
jgi:hypothetical protein